MTTPAAEAGLGREPLSGSEAKMDHDSGQGLRGRGPASQGGAFPPGPPENSNSYRDCDHNFSCFRSACYIPGFRLSTLCHLEQQGQEDRQGERPGR